MKKEELWNQYVAKNPQFEGDGNVTLSAKGLRKLFDQTFDRGHELGFSNGVATQKMMDSNNKSSKSSFEDLFGGMFKK